MPTQPRIEWALRSFSWGKAAEASSSPPTFICCLHGMQRKKIKFGDVDNYYYYYFITIQQKQVVTYVTECWSVTPLHLAAGVSQTL